MKKLSGRSGFTLAELLASMLIMLLASGLVVQTLTLAVQQYQSRIQANDAQEFYTEIAEVFRELLEVKTTAARDTNNILDGYNNDTRYNGANPTVQAEINVYVIGTDTVDYYQVDVKMYPYEKNTPGNELINSSFIVRPILNNVAIELST